MLAAKIYVPFNNFLPELFSIVTSFLPAYSLVGENTLNTVCRQWNEDLMSDSQIVPRKKLANVVNSCKTSEDALNILTDQTLLKQLSLEHFLRILSYHPEMTKRFINDFQLYLYSDQWKLMIKEQAWLSESALSELWLEFDLKLTALITLLKADFNAAQYFLSKFPLGKELGFNQGNQLPVSVHIEMATLFFVQMRIDVRGLKRGDIVIELALAHLPIAWSIIKNPKFLSQLPTDVLSDLAEAHLPIAEYLIPKPEIFGNPSKSHLIKVGQSHLTIADYLLNNQQLLDMIGPDGLFQLGLAHLSIAKRIFNTPELLAKICAGVPFLVAFRLKSLGGAHLFIAERILRDPILAKQAECTPYTFADRHVPLRKKVFSTPELWENLISSDFKSFSSDELLNYSHDIIVIEEIFSQKLLCKKLEQISSGNLGILASIIHPMMAELLIKHPALSARLPKEVLLTLSEKTLAISKEIVEQNLHNNMDKVSSERVKTYAAMYDTVQQHAAKIRESQKLNHNIVSASIF